MSIKCVQLSCEHYKWHLSMSFPSKLGSWDIIVDLSDYLYVAKGACATGGNYDA